MNKDNNLGENIGFGAYSPIFGNMLFGGATQPQPMPVAPYFQQIPYMSVSEASQGLAQLAPQEAATMTPGTTQGNLNVNGSLTATDQTGAVRVQMGFQQGGF